MTASEAPGNVDLRSIDADIATHLQNTTFEQLPEEVVEAAKLALLDLTGVMLAATTLGEGCEPFSAIAREMGGSAQATVLQGGFRAPASLAALANGALAHAVDYDSVHDAAVGHPDSACIPAAMAMAERCAPVEGRKFITAIALGSDLYSRMSLAITERSSIWFDVAISSAFGAAAAAAKVRGLTASQMLDALSLSASQCTCTWEFHESRRSDIRAVREAFAAQAGVMGALLAARGVGGVERPIGGKAGFFQAYAHGRFDPEVLLAGLGKDFLGARVSFKPYPSCRGTHAFVDAAIELGVTHDLRPGDIRSIKAVGPALFEYLMKTDTPGTAIDAKFSLRYTVAAALQNRRLVLDDFAADAFQAPETLRLGKLLSYEVDPQVPRNDSSCGALEISMKDGRTFARPMRHARGHPARPLSRSEVIDKFLDCAAHARRPVARPQLDTLIREVFALETLQDAGSLMRHLRE